METVHNVQTYNVKMRLLQKLFATLVFFVPCLSSNNGCFDANYGIVSSDQAVRPGRSFVFWCTINHETSEKNNVTSRNLTITYAGHEVENADINIVDNYTVEYKVQKATPNDAGLYQCYVPVIGFKERQLVCLSHIEVGYEPQEVSNFSCKGYNLQSLTCSWIAPQNAVETKYSLSDYLFNNSRLSRDCRIYSSSSCEFNVRTKPPYMRNQNILNFILTGKNAFGSSKQYFSIRHFEIVKPAEPSRVNFRNITTNSMVIDIFAPYGLEYGEYPDGLVYEVVYYSVSTKLDGVYMAKAEGEINARFKIENLVPNTQYKFSFRCHLNITGGRYIMSNATNATERTKPDEPYLAPEVDPSGFDMLSINNDVTVTLYWKAIPSEFENGEEFHYVIRYNEYFVSSRWRSRRATGTLVNVGNSTTYTIKDLDKDSAYIFTIIAVNSEGQSSNQSAVIVVDKAKKLLPGPKDISAILFNRGHYDISWRPADPDQNSFTIAACETLKTRPAACDGPISFVTVHNRTDYKFAILNPNTNYQFAVAATSEKRTSGLQWASCIVNHGVAYDVKNVKLMLKTSTSLKVSWSYTCPEVSKVVQEIEVAMCPTQKRCSQRNYERCGVNDTGVNGWPTQRFTDSSVTEVLLGNLQPFTRYFAVVRVRTDAGWGQRSGYVCEMTMPSAPADPPSGVYAEVQPVENSIKASIYVSYEPPRTPNGIISRYVIYYNDTSSNEGGKEKEVRVQDNNRTAAILDNILYYTNYSIEVTACVQQACSALSEPFFLYTGVSNPGIVNLPRVEMGERAVNISWDAPVLPNGPLDVYEISMSNKESSVEKYFNVSGQNFLSLARRCDTEDADHKKYEFKVRAINIKDGVQFYGDFSQPLVTLLCSAGGKSLIWVLYIIAGVCAGIILLILICFGIKWIIRNIKTTKETKVKLPVGLENPLSANDPFSKTQGKDNNYTIPYQRGYARFFSPGSDLRNTNEVTTRDSSGRNLSGDSNLSERCHDSISSANTTKTQNSIDSGAEIESPPSPDSFCSGDSGSANTTPRTFKPSLDIVDEINQLISKDSGLDKETPIANFPSKEWYAAARDAPLGAYSRFAVQQAASNKSPYVDLRLLPGGSLSNSEPSIKDYDYSLEEPLVSTVMQPYSRFGIAKSASNDINLLRDSRPFAGSSKFGHVYRPPNQQVFSAMPVLGDKPCFKKEDVLLSGTDNCAASGLDAYSKFGVAEMGGVDNPSNDPSNVQKSVAAGSGNLTNGHVQYYTPEHELRGAVGGFTSSKPSNPYDPQRPKHDGCNQYYPCSNNSSGDSDDVSPPELCQSSRPVNGSDSPPSLQNPANWSGPSHVPLDDESPEEGVEVQFADEFINNALDGCFQGKIVPLLNGFVLHPVPQADPDSSVPLDVKLKNCMTVDELMKCVDNGCLPDLGDLRCSPQKKVPDFGDQGNCEQVGDSDAMELDEMPAAVSSDSEPQPIHLVPNVCIAVPSVEDSNNVAQAVPPSNSSELV